MKKNYKKTLVLSSVVIMGLLSMNSYYGPGNYYGAEVTGAPFNGFSTCTNCHSGGSFSAAASIQLLSGGLPVTSYISGSTYTVRITRSASGVPASGGWGFQITAATSPGNVNINAWGALPANTQNTSLSGRNYIEHTQKLASGTTQVDIPWTAPAWGTGSVKFYMAVNTVNGNGGSSGDQVVSTSLTITQNPLPVTWYYFKGQEVKGDVLLEWATSNEVDNGHFTIEKSMDGETFSFLTKTAAKNDGMPVNNYSFTDEHPSAVNYYRIKQTDLSGNESYFRTIQVKTGNGVTAMHYLQENNLLLKIQSQQTQMITVDLYSQDGKKMVSRAVTLQDGSNTINLEKPEVPGIYLLSASIGGKPVYSGKVLVP